MLFRHLLLCVAALAVGIVPAAAARQQRPAKVLFGMTSVPAPMAAAAIGGYARGCLAGGKQLAADGPAWQAMRPSRNRTWGTPILIRYVETLARDANAKDGWPGLLVGDLAQPRGGPMLTGHASHQIGLDADIWLTPMPDRKLTVKERETIAATSMLAADSLSVDPNVFTIGHAKLLRRAASYPQVARIFVHPAIKKALCDQADAIDPKDRSWLRTVRPWFGHFYHFHVRLDCPAGMNGCIGQAPLPEGDGCGKEVESWLDRMRPKKEVATAPKPKTGPKPKVAKKEALTLAQLPAACATVLAAGYPDGLKRFNIDLAEDIEAPTRNPRRATALAAATPGIATAPAGAPADAAAATETAAPAAPAATASADAAAPSVAAQPAAAPEPAQPAKARFVPAQMIPGMGAAEKFAGGFSRARAKPPAKAPVTAPLPLKPLLPSAD